MNQTENTAIVLRFVNYRDNDRMVTLFNPRRGRMDVMIRNCRKPKSHNLNAAELFALGDYMVYESGGHATVTSVNLIETFYALREDYEKLTCGIYLLNLVEAVVEPEQERQELFMLLLHTLNRLNFYDQPWRPLLAGFLLHFADCEGFKPRLNHCVRCGKRLETGPYFFDFRDGGLCCGDCRDGDFAKGAMPRVTEGEVRWMRQALQSGSASWVEDGDQTAPLKILRMHVEGHLGRKLKSAAVLPE